MVEKEDKSFIVLLENKGFYTKWINLYIAIKDLSPLGCEFLYKSAKFFKWSILDFHLLIVTS